MFIQPLFNTKIAISLLCLSIFAWNCLNAGFIERAPARKHFEHDLELVSKAHSDSEKIMLAKQLLGLPVDAAEGILCWTYLTRLYNVPFTANRDDMAEVQLERDVHYNYLAEGVPDWFPEFLTSERNNFKCNVSRNLIWNWVAGLNVFAPQTEFEAAWAKKVSLEKELCVKSGKLFSDEELDRKVIIAKLGLKPSTSYDDAIDSVESIVRLFSLGGLSSSELKEVDRQQARKEALLVLHCSDDAGDRELAAKLALVERAVKLESPNSGKIKLWY